MMRSILPLFLFGILPVLTCACSTTGPENSSNLDPAKLRDSRIWYVVDLGVAPEAEREGALPIRLMYANVSHSDFKDGAFAGVSMMDNELMLGCLDAFKIYGMFSTNGGTNIGATDPVRYADGLRAKPYKWIAVEYDGQHTILTRPSSPDDPRMKIFQNCEALVLKVSTAAMGQGSAGQGSGVPAEWGRPRPR